MAALGFGVAGGGEGAGDEVAAVGDGDGDGGRLVAPVALGAGVAALVAVGVGEAAVGGVVVVEGGTEGARAVVVVVANGTVGARLTVWAGVGGALVDGFTAQPPRVMTRRLVRNAKTTEVSSFFSLFSFSSLGPYLPFGRKSKRVESDPLVPKMEQQVLLNPR